MNDFETIKQKILQNPKVVKAYEEKRPEFQTARKLIQKKIKQNIEKNHK